MNAALRKGTSSVHQWLRASRHRARGHITILPPNYHGVLGRSFSSTASERGGIAAAFHHVPVLLEETIARWYDGGAAGGGIFCDVTCGGGGHTEALLKRHSDARVLCIDRDVQALEASASRLSQYIDEGRVLLRQGKFSNLPKTLQAEEDAELREFAQGGVRGILADLGFSSHQIDTADRGFSFLHDGPLDMRMGLADGTAAEAVNALSPRELAEVFMFFGDVSADLAGRASRQIAKDKPITTTGQLTESILKALPPGRGKMHPATLFFQALREVVNDLPGELESLVTRAPLLLSPGASLVIISFASHEDRVVKRAFRDMVVNPPSAECVFTLPRRRGTRPSKQEVQRNKRSRSAVLRVLQRREAGDRLP